MPTAQEIATRVRDRSAKKERQRLVKLADKKPPRGRLTERQRLLVRFYFTDAMFSKKEAGRMSGYPATTQIYREFSKPQVMAEMRRVADNADKRFEVTYDKLIDELSKIAFYNPADVFKYDEEGKVESINLDAASIDSLAALGKIRIETKFVDDGDGPQPIRTVEVEPLAKLKAIEQLMKHGGFSREVKRHTHEHSLVDRLREGRARMNNKNRLEEKPVDAEFEVVD